MRLTDKMIVSQIGDAWFAVSVGNNKDSASKTVRLNNTGKVIFDYIQENKTPDEIADLLTERYEVDQKTALESVMDVISTLKDHGVIEDE